MTTEEYIKSGMLELYCMGALSAEDRMQAENMLQHPEVKEELNRIELALEQTAMEMAITPTPSVRIKTKQRIYRLQAGENKPLAPFIEKGVSFDEIYAWALAQTVTEPAGNDLIKLHDLNDSFEVVNFFAWVKEGHPEETHDSYLEYIVVLEGGCDMNFEGTIKSYKKGDIIEIPLHVRHTATVNPENPMWALVQRQNI